METFLIKAIQLLLSLSLLVVIHEFGHFLFAKLFKIKVEKFYLFFDPWFSIFKYKPKNSDTEYGIGWLPLGGYVKIAGMIDESMDKEQMAQPAKSWEFRSKPAWQRLLVMLGGVLFNVILAVFIFSMMVLYWGDSYIPMKDMRGGMEFASYAKDAGFQDRDILISADGTDLNTRFGILGMSALMQFLDADVVVVERDGELKTISMPEKFADRMIVAKESPFMAWQPTRVDSVLKDSEAERIGLQRGDSITAVNGKAFTSFLKLRDALQEEGKDLKAGEKKEIIISYVRDTAYLESTVALDSTCAIGFSGHYDLPKVQTDKYNFFTSFPVGLKLGKEMLFSYVAQSRFIFSKEGVKSVSGFAGIGGMFPAQWDWFSFWTMTAFLSLALAFMNILPIPLLDGGHIMFLLYEMISGRTPNEKFQEYAQLVGMALILGLLILANGNDVIRYIFN